MTAWRADGRTHPEWRSCDHYILADIGDTRCSQCNAIPIDGYVQPSRGSMSGVVGRDMQPIIDKARDLGGLKGDETSRKRFNYPVKP